MRKIIILILILNGFILLSFDLSTPIDGNLYSKTNLVFSNFKYKLFESDRILEEYNLSFNKNRIVYDTENRQINSENALTKDSNIVSSEHGITVRLTGNSSVYAHGILGDTIEATGFIVSNGNKIIGRFELNNNQVYETLRPTIADIVPENAGLEILLTVSDKNNGSKVVVYSLEGMVLGESESIGKGYRWLHLLGVAPLGANKSNRVVLVQTPHIGGILKILKWENNKLVVINTINGVSTHQIGSDNLNMAILYDNGVLIPSNDFRSLYFLSVIDDNITRTNEYHFKSRISTNLFFKDSIVWIGLADGSIIQLFR